MAEKLIIAASVEEALAGKNAASAFLAGGTEINKLDSTVDAAELISIRKLDELKKIEETDGKIQIGAMVTFQNVVDSVIAPAYFKEACMMMASRTKRNMATIGGNIALMRDDSYIMPALLAAKAGISYIEKDGKQIDTCICKFMEERQAGNLQDALILGISLDPERKVRNTRSANTAMSHSRMNISLGYAADGSDIAIGCEVKNAGLFRMRKLEEKITECPDITEDEIMSMIRDCKACEIPTDMFGSEEYKRYLMGAIISKMLSDARKEVC